MTTRAPCRPKLGRKTIGRSHMKKIVLIFGLLSGAILAGMMAVAIPLCMKGEIIDFEKSEVLGYTSMVLAFVMVFVGIRSYRENVGGGQITFGRAFKVGILIALIASAVYVVAWQVMYHGFFPDFMDKYSQHLIDKLRASGASDAQLLAKQQEMADFKRLYANPLVNVGMTFLEVFPIGLLVTLISAAILR